MGRLDGKVPRLMEAGGGSVVNMSSVAGLQGVPMHVYVAAKGGVIAFTRSLAGSYAGDGIRANAICPGLVLTERVKQRLGAGSDGPKAVAQAAAVDAQGRKYPFSVGQPDDIAQVALFLASDESRMITGAVMPADGGMTAY